MKTTLAIFLPIFAIMSGCASSVLKRGPSSEKQKAPCGQEVQSLESRIYDCSFSQTTSRDRFVLVLRDKNGQEIYKDKKTNIIWGDLVTPPAIDFQQVGFEEAQAYCQNKYGEASGLYSLKWDLP